MWSMLKICIALFISLFAVCKHVVAQPPDLVKYVNPISGTASSTTKSALKHGSVQANFANTVPSVCTPFAMTQWTPQTQSTEKNAYRLIIIRTINFQAFGVLIGSAVPAHRIMAA
jgi:putative alpha-1,2-mannosidase